MPPLHKCGEVMYVRFCYLRANRRSPAERSVFFLLLLKQRVQHEGWISRCAFVFRTPAETYMYRERGRDWDFDEWVAADYTGNAHHIKYYN